MLKLTRLQACQDWLTYFGVVEMMNGIVLVAVVFYSPQGAIEHGRVCTVCGHNLIVKIDKLEIFPGFHMLERIETSLLSFGLEFALLCFGARSLETYRNVGGVVDDLRTDDAG